MYILKQSGAASHVPEYATSSVLDFPKCSTPDVVRYSNDIVVHDAWCGTLHCIGFLAAGASAWISDSLHQMEAAVPSYTRVWQEVVTGVRARALVLDPKKVASQYGLELLHEGLENVLLVYGRTGKQLKMQVEDVIANIFSGPAVPLVVADILFTLQGCHENMKGFIGYLTVTNRQRIEQMLPVIAELRAVPDTRCRARDDIVDRHRLDTKNFNGMVTCHDLTDPDALMAYVRRLEEIEKNWSPEEVLAKLATLPRSSGKRNRRDK